MPSLSVISAPLAWRACTLLASQDAMTRALHGRLLSSRRTVHSTSARRAQTLGSDRQSSESSTAENYDVVIVGGGLAGLALAGALTASQAISTTARVALIEGGSLARPLLWSPSSAEYSNRVSSITNASRDFLEGIGAWDHVDESRSMPIEEILVWDGVSDARITFRVSDVGRVPGSDSSYGDEMARLIENLNLQRALLRLLQERKEARLYDNVMVSQIERSEKQGDDWPVIKLSDGRVLRARLLVGADGHNSPVRSYAQIPSYGWSYPTHAIVATMAHSPSPVRPDNTTAYQRFLPTGPIAFLPISPSASSLVWSTKPALVAALKALDPDALRQMINAAFRLPFLSMQYLHKILLQTHEAGTPLSPSQVAEEIAFRERSHSIESNSALSSSADNQVGIPPIGSEDYPPLVTAIKDSTIASFPLRFMHADTYMGEGSRARTVLVGDAAHNVHPLAGQGLNMGLADVEELVRCIEQGALLGADIGSHTVLQPYARSRYLANHSLLSVTDKLHKLYSFESQPIVWARSVGLEVLNELSSIKGTLMQGAGAQSENAKAAGPWNAAATGLEALNLTLHTARTTVSGLGTIAGTIIGTALGKVISGDRPRL